MGNYKPHIQCFANNLAKVEFFAKALSHGGKSVLTIKYYKNDKYKYMEINNTKEQKILIGHLSVNGLNEFYISSTSSTKEIAKLALEELVLDKTEITPELIASFEKKVARASKKVEGKDNVISRLDTKYLDSTSTFTFFKQEVFSCGEYSELKKGDKVALLYPEPCLDFHDLYFKESDNVVAVKHDEYFTPEKACDIFLANTTYPHTREMRKKCPKCFKDVLWEELVDNDCVFSGLIEVAFVILK